MYIGVMQFIVDGTGILWIICRSAGDEESLKVNDLDLLMMMLIIILISNDQSSHIKIMAKAVIVHLVTIQATYIET